MRTRAVLRTILVIGVLSFGASVVGCGSSSSGGDGGNAGADATGGGGGDTAGPADTTTGDRDTKPAPFDGAAGDTILPPQAECVFDEHCEQGKLCDCNYECIPAPEGYCVEDKNCGSDGFCDPCTRKCRGRLGLCEPCVSENRCDLLTGVCQRVGVQCESGNLEHPSHCLDFATTGGASSSFCGRTCLNNLGCPMGYECVEIPGIPDKQCVPFIRECGSQVDCEADGDCPYGEVCEATYGTCRPGCVDDQQCQVGEVCSAFRCQTACDTTENPCTPPEECVEGRCKIPGSCVDKYDCEEAETFCNPDTHMCEPGCLEDFDCKRSGYICVDGACEKQPCERNWYCAFEEVCNKDVGECEPAEGPYCDTCDPEAENPCGEGNECIGLQDEDGNDLGDYCFVQCQPGEYDRCPQGYQCAPLQDQDGNVQNEVCFRDCSKPPVGLD